MKIKIGCELIPWGKYFQTEGVREPPMKVKDFIEILKTHNPDADILITGYEGGFHWLRKNLVIAGSYKHSHTPPYHVITSEQINDPHYGIDYSPDGGNLEPDKNGYPCVFISRYEVDYE